ncbi:alpha/beta fold hydrolase [Haloarcula pellucida]|uniref:Hydrolase n=1 Tax=Haloarcula pellucida TaxID=1427151 RepID=A0A830GHI4_9EURY|nr:alpha/beta hydrolase [Halomicroarcula pellucida]MBX0347460.1 alpha/beta hydrolase [Halomicroarcula pellucida]GGN88786.1 hydrolase [Halomicroarcula pellucida]
MPDAYNDGVRLAYERAGPVDAETVVFVEGLGYGRWMWRWTRRAVDDYETILWDNRGTGASSEPAGPYTVEQMAGDLSAVLDDADVDAAHVVGASMGGMIAQQFALDDDRAESLTLMCTSPGGPEAVPVPEETQARMYEVPEGYDEREAIRHKMAPALTDAFADENPDLIERIVDWRLDSDASDRARELQGAAVAEFDVSDRLDEIRLPALVLHGTADRVVPLENGELLAEGLPDAEFHRLEGAPHLLFVERAEDVNDYLTEFLEDV